MNTKCLVLLSYFFSFLTFAQGISEEEFFNSPVITDEEVKLSSLEEAKNFIRENIIYRLEAGINSYGGAEMSALAGIQVIDDFLDIGINSSLITGFYNSSFRIGPYIQANLKFDSGTYYVRVAREYSNDYRAEYNIETGNYDQYEYHGFENTYVVGREVRKNNENLNYNIKVREFLNDNGEDMKIYSLGLGIRF